MAYYRSGWRGKSLILSSQFWVGVNGNFIDICVLEWCKLFGDLGGKHFWKKGVSDPQAFIDGLLNKLGMRKDEFEGYIIEMKTYRDKYIAHWDLDEKAKVPKLDITKKSAIYLYNYLLDREDQGGYFNDAPRDASQFYKDALEEGKTIYRNSVTK